MTSGIVAIHQPNFFPWLGYFSKIARADIFVFLDRVAYPKSGSGMGSWTNRVRIAVQGKSVWFGCPLEREPGDQMINTVRIDEGNDWRGKRLKTLEQSYTGTSGFETVYPTLRKLLEARFETVSEFNIENIKSLCAFMNIDAEFVCQSDLDTRGASTELLIDIVKKVGCDTYLSGSGGAKEYQDEGKFSNHGIQLLYNDFEPLPYKQLGNGPFLPRLSVIDALMNCGPEGTRELIYAET